MPALSSNSREILIRIAREALEDLVRTGTIRPFKPEDSVLWEPRPCFVTLRKKGGQGAAARLRGCIGNFRTERPLFEEVVRMTRAAAFEDPRFPPVRADELDQIEIEVSILSPLEKIRSSAEVEVGRHGIFLEWGNRTGAFLPEVAVEMGWGAEEFVRRCAEEKAHLPEAVWPEITISRFTTEKIKEKP